MTSDREILAGLVEAARSMVYEQEGCEECSGATAVEVRFCEALARAERHLVFVEAWGAEGSRPYAVDL